MFTLTNTEQCFTNFHFFFLKEYEIESVSGNNEQLLTEFIDSPEFIDSFSPSKEIESFKGHSLQDVKRLASETMHGPFVIEHISKNNFKNFKGSQLNDLLFDFGESPHFLEDPEEYSINIKTSLHLIEKYSIEDDNLFFLNKHWFKEPGKALAIYSSIYTYYLLFIAINTSGNRLILLNYGYD
jgi:hypothetical protein